MAFIRHTHYYSFDDVGSAACVCCQVVRVCGDFSDASMRGLFFVSALLSKYSYRFAVNIFAAFDCLKSVTEIDRIIRIGFWGLFLDLWSLDHFGPPFG